MPSTTTWTLLAAALPYAMAAAPVRTAAQIANDPVAKEANMKVMRYTAWTWVAIFSATLIYRWGLVLLRHVRRLSNLNHGTSSDSKQKYFSIPSDNYAKVKRDVITAPLWKKRHNREFKLSAAANMGTLPGRLQTMFLLGYLGMQIAFCVWTIEWSNPELWYDDARNRTGVLSAMNMIPLFLLAGRNNPLIFLLGISFDTYNLIHRWLGRMVVIEAVLHTAFWMGGKTHEKGWTVGSKVIAISLQSSALIQTGMIATSAFILLMLLSPSVVRHAFYETFLGIHILLAVAAVVGVWMHCEGMREQGFVMAAVVIWIIERSIRIISLLRRNVGNGGTHAEVEALPGDAVRVTLRVAKPWKFTPGQHVYMYMPSIGGPTSHPFSLAWSEEEDEWNTEKALPVTRQDAFGSRRTNMSLIIRRRTGFTDALFKKAEMSPGGKFTSRAFVEGPYGEQSFASYGTVMLFAAGVGITHQVPHVRDLVAGYANGTHATRKVTLVWIIQSPEHLEWIRPWMTQILGMEKRRDILRILLFVTRPRSTKEIHSPSSSVQMFPGKPDCGALIQKEQERQVGAMAISVCGTGGLADDVRKSVRDRCTNTEIDIFEEAFSW
jgi:predicted ferric reductase